jgi:hypothetical protein
MSLALPDLLASPHNGGAGELTHGVDLTSYSVGSAPFCSLNDYKEKSTMNNQMIRLSELLRPADEGAAHIAGENPPAKISAPARCNVHSIRETDGSGVLVVDEKVLFHFDSNGDLVKLSFQNDRHERPADLVFATSKWMPPKSQ